MNAEPVRIGLMPTKRDVFNHPETFETCRRIRDLALSWKDSRIDIVDIDDVTERGMLESEAGAQAVARKFARIGVAGIFVPHCNFGSESNVAFVASRLKVPVLLWGPRDGDPEGQNDLSLSVVGRARDSQCGLFATSKALRRVNAPFTYIQNVDLESGRVPASFRAFAAVCAVVKAFRETKILQIGVRPDPFWTVICNEGELLERFGIRVFPVAIGDLTETARTLEEKEPARVAAAAERIVSLTPAGGIGAAAVRRFGAYYEAVHELCGRHNCNAVATSCWGAFRKAMGISACAVNGHLASSGLPVACETDIHGAITSRMLQAAVLHANPVFFADVTIRHPSNDNAELLWHCGNFPPEFALDKNDRSVRDCVMSGVVCPGKSYFPLREGEITVCRFDGDHGEYSLLMGEGKSIRGPKTVGTYCWFEVGDWAEWEERLVNGPYIHHIAGTYGRVAPILHEACKYLGIAADPVEPDADGVRAFWRGGQT